MDIFRILHLGSAVLYEDCFGSPPRLINCYIEGNTPLIDWLQLAPNKVQPASTWHSCNVSVAPRHVPLYIGNSVLSRALSSKNIPLVRPRNPAELLTFADVSSK